jgi:preprotein translocase subunit SecD
MRISALTASVLSIVVLAGCSGTDDGDGEGDRGDADAGTRTDTDFLGDLDEPAAIQFRLVTASAAQPSAQLDDVDCDAPTPTPADEPASGCDPSGQPYLLEAAAFETPVESAEASTDPGTGDAVVLVTLPDLAAEDLQVLSTQYAGGDQQVAIFVAGRVVSAPVFGSTIDDGALQISGGDLTPEVAEGVVAALT